MFLNLKMKLNKKKSLPLYIKVLIGSNYSLIKFFLLFKVYLTNNFITSIFSLFDYINYIIFFC